MNSQFVAQTTFLIWYIVIFDLESTKIVQHFENIRCLCNVLNVQPHLPLGYCLSVICRSVSYCQSWSGISTWRLISTPSQKLVSRDGIHLVWRGARTPAPDLDVRRTLKWRNHSWTFVKPSVDPPKSSNLSMDFDSKENFTSSTWVLWFSSGPRQCAFHVRQWYGDRVSDYDLHSFRVIFNSWGQYIITVLQS